MTYPKDITSARPNCALLSSSVKPLADQYNLLRLKWRWHGVLSSAEHGRLRPRKPSGGRGRSGVRAGRYRFPSPRDRRSLSAGLKSVVAVDSRRSCARRFVWVLRSLPARAKEKMLRRGVLRVYAPCCIQFFQWQCSAMTLLCFHLDLCNI